jgi:hypothetical protein
LNLNKEITIQYFFTHNTITDNSRLKKSKEGSPYFVSEFNAEIFAAEMSYSQPPFNMMQSPYPGCPPPMAASFGFVPPWATELLQDVKHIKEQMKTVDKIEKKTR